eukprot:3751815-Pyramimonas_sp.AAC.1
MLWPGASMASATAAGRPAGRRRRPTTFSVAFRKRLVLSQKGRAFVKKSRPEGGPGFRRSRVPLVGSAP